MEANWETRSTLFTLFTFSAGADIRQQQRATELVGPQTEPTCKTSLGSFRVNRAQRSGSDPRCETGTKATSFTASGTTCCRCRHNFNLLGRFPSKGSSAPTLHTQSDTRPSSIRCRRMVRILSWYLRARFSAQKSASGTPCSAHKSATIPVGRKSRMQVTSGRFQYLEAFPRRKNHLLAHCFKPTKS